MARRLELDELVERFTLLPDETALLRNKSGATRLGFALLLKLFELEARFPRYAEDVPRAAVGYVAGRPLAGITGDEIATVLEQLCGQRAPATWNRNRAASTLWGSSIRPPG